MTIGNSNQQLRFLLTKPFSYLAVMALLTLTFAGCGGKTGSSTGTGTQPTSPSAPAVPPGWMNIDRPYVSFDYPKGWTLNEVTNLSQPLLDVYDPAQAFNSQLLVQFAPNYPNNSDVGDQCADAKQYLTNFYNHVFLPLATDPNQYPRTTVTWLYLPSIGGSLGGAIGTVSISYEENVGSSQNYLVDLQAVPRQGGLYLIGIWSPDYLATPSYANTFLGTLALKHDFLPKGSNCSYLN